MPGDICFIFCHDGFRKKKSRDCLILRTDGRCLRHSVISCNACTGSNKVTGESSVCISWEPESGIQRCAILQRAKVHTRFSKTLHSDQTYADSCPLCTKCGSSCRTKAGHRTASQISLMGTPISGQCTHSPCRNTSDILLPFRSLIDAVFFS